MQSERSGMVQLMGWILAAKLGYSALFFASFLAATIVPFSSEAILAGMLLGNFDVVACIALATAGNWLGGMTGYWLGYLGKWEWLEKYFNIPKDRLNNWHKRLHRYGVALAFFCCLPSVGDFIAVGLGFIRSNVVMVALLMLAGKLIRYMIVAWLIVEGKLLF